MSPKKMIGLLCACGRKLCEAFLISRYRRRFRFCSFSLFLPFSRKAVLYVGSFRTAGTGFSAQKSTRNFVHLYSFLSFFLL